MEKYLQACIEINKNHSLDKNIETIEGIDYPAELLYANRLVDRLENFKPDAGELLKLAARCQHFKRWEILRNAYPMDKVGYLKWRKALYIYQSEESAKILEQVGYDDEFISQFKMIVEKKEISKNPNAQIIEDVACLVFMDYYLEDFSKKHEPEKLKSIIAKTWKKMSNSAKSEALKFDFPGDLKKIILEALNL